MRVKIISDLPQYDLSDNEVINTFNTKLGTEISWSYSPQDKILDIEASEETINLLLSEFKDVIEVLPEVTK